MSNTKIEIYLDDLIKWKESAEEIGSAEVSKDNWQVSIRASFLVGALNYHIKRGQDREPVDGVIKCESYYLSKSES